ncbi:MAG: hypothetical protein M0R74_10005 [Dehalococcoidia bacterium]|nr:hypothetical protein [Dehalococcoidia bacterium]
MKTYQRMVLMIGAIVGVIAGGFAVAAAVTNSSVADTDDAVHNQVQPQALPIGKPLLPVTDGREPLLFSDNVAASDSGGSTVTIGDTVINVLPRADDGSVHFSATLAGGAIIDGYGDRDVIKTGLAYIAWQDHGGPIHILGIVSDDVAEVVVGSHSIEITNNFWYFVADGDDDVSLVVVRGVDPSNVARLGH